MYVALFCAGIMSQHAESSQMTPAQSLQTPYEWQGIELTFVFLMFCISMCDVCGKCYISVCPASRRRNVDSVFVLTLKIAVFWYATLHSLVEVY